MSSQGADKTTAESESAGASRKLLELLVCPLTKGPLKYDPQTQELISLKAHLAYPIRNGVPQMTAEGARRLDEDENAGR